MRIRWPVVFVMTSLPAVAEAHLPGDGNVGGFAAGFAHPFSGFDHLLAMIAVGMWGAQLGMPAIWVLPVAFPLVMACGGVLGILAIPMPFPEQAIMLSVIALGAMIAFGRRPPLWIATVLVSFFAIFHGYAHGRELPEQASAVAYSAGFVLATGSIHLTGIGIGTVKKLPHGAQILRAGGAAIAAAGCLLAWQLGAG